MIIEFKPNTFLIQKKLKSLLVSDNLKSFEGDTVLLNDGVLENTNHFIQKLSETFTPYEIPEINGIWNGTISFLWEFSIKPIKQLEFYIGKGKITAIAEDELYYLRIYKEFSFSPKSKKFPKEVTEYFKHFFSKNSN